MVSGLAHLPKGPDSSVGSVLGWMYCVMQQIAGSNLLRASVRDFPLELTWFLTQFPQTLSDERINRGLVCVHIHSFARMKKKKKNGEPQRYSLERRIRRRRMVNIRITAGNAE